MKRFLTILAAALLAAAVPAGFACAEAPLELATQTDLCAHENTELVYYFEDTPVYRSISPYTHMASGPATVETVCADCGATLAVEYEEDAQEINPHIFRKGRCVLCGRESLAAAAARETVIDLIPAEGMENVYTAALDAAALADATELVVLRTEALNVAVVMETDELKAMLERTGTSLAATFTGKEGERSADIALAFLDADGKAMEETAPDPQWTSMRIWCKRTISPRVSFVNTEGEASEVQPAWSDAGYYTVPWMGNGSYGY